ncbi:guanylate kinase [Tessaracoccus antarcticus]|uniref:Guanylate kinase n=1 Tax=Tessaracoccus antarcticus TaxID=2479848 RepID=A0A3M0G3A9_9ACTN|nr:guanylate kinase [Tessaracoccus antarcticus]RMB59018.1 guanylate kinase [Tessaracoccus antarcticus]
MADKQPAVWVISGPSGVGKGTVCNRLRERRPDLHYSVSMTTRAPRPDEVDGTSYHFVTPEDFQDLVERGMLLEYAQVHGTNYYGTPREPVEKALAQRTPVVLEIDLQGARQVKQNMPEARLVFLTPPSWDELVNRLRRRGTEDEATQERRLETARMELAARDEADHVVENRAVEDTVSTLIGLMSL